MMHHALVTRPQFNGTDIAGLFELDRHHEVSEHIAAACGQRERTRNLHHQIRRPQLPSVWKMRRGRQIGWVALSCSALYPLRKHADLAVRKPARSFEVTVPGLRRPR